MGRVLFSWRGRGIQAYPALLYVGLVAGTIAGTLTAAAAGLDPVRTYGAILVLLLPALAGARLLFVAAHWRAYRREPARIWRRSEGGFSMYGGLLLALACSAALLPAIGLRFWAFWDAVTITMLVGMAFARVGCLLNGCCAGRETAGLLGFRLADQRGVVRRRIPTQCLELLVTLIVLGLAGALWEWRRFEGGVFLPVVVAYGAARAVLEGTRDDIDRVGGWSLHRALSVGLATFAAAALWWLAPR